MSASERVRRLPLRAQVVLIVVALGLVPLAIQGYLDIVASRTALIEQASFQLESVRELKKNDLEKYLATKLQENAAFTSGPFIIDGVIAMTTAFYQLPADIATSPTTMVDSLEQNLTTEFVAAYREHRSQTPDVADVLPQNPAGLAARYLYAAENPYAYDEKLELDRAADPSRYSAEHARYHPVIREMMLAVGLYDIQVISPQRGDIVYSVRKGLEYGTNVVDGPFRSSGIAQVFKHVMATGEATIGDFTAYLPTLDRPVLHVGSPVRVNDAITGVIIMSVPADNLNKVVQNVSGMGETGHSFLIGSDKILRSQPRGESGTSILQSIVDTDATRRVLNGETGMIRRKDDQGRAVLSAFAPLNIEGLDWSLVVEIDAAEVGAGLAPIVRNALLIFGLAGCVLLISAFALARRIVRPVNHAARVATKIANGDLTSEIRTRSGSEIDDMLHALDQMQTQLRDRRENDERVMQRMSRVTQALAGASAGILIADDTDCISFANQSAVDTLRQSGISGLQNITVETLTGRQLRELPVRFATDEDRASAHKLAIGTQTILTVTSSIRDEHNKRLGSVIEWRDWTDAQKVENEISALIGAARSGDLTGRLNLDAKDDFFRTLSVGINDLVAISQQVVDDMGHVLSALARGDLTAEVTTQYDGAFEQLKTDANSTVARLTQIVHRIQSGSDCVHDAAGSLRTSTVHINELMQAQTQTLRTTTAAMTLLDEAVKGNAEHAAKASRLSDAVSTSASSGRDVVGSAVDAMGRIHEASTRIVDIIGVIDEIAFQTNLLALNASVEAARAGDQGLGFAVVAREVRELAERSARAAQEVKGLIQDSVAKVGDGSHLVNQSGQIFEQIVGGITEVAAVASEISDSSLAQAQKVEQISRAVNSMDEATRSSVEVFATTAEAAAQMDTEATELKATVSFFDGLPQDGSTVSRAPNPRRLAS